MDSSLDAPIALVRAIHFAAAIVVFGQFAFLFAVSPGRHAPPHFFRTTASALAVTLASALVWLSLEAVAMSGLPAREALSMGMLAVVATQTQYGNLWLIRMLLYICLTGLVAALHGTDDRQPPFAAALIAGVLAGLALAALAGMGHAGASQGVERAFRLAADAAHLLAAGAWLGALLPLIGVLGAPDATAPVNPLRRAALATQRFSILGVASVLIILISGIVNAAYTLMSAAALVTSQYGWLLLVKVGIFAIIIAIAAINRFSLTPKLVSAAYGSGEQRAIVYRLRRNAITECVLGFAIVAIVGKLGITLPGGHG